jgi:hypothetical protein
MNSCAQGAFARMAIKAGTGALDYSSGATRLAFFKENLGKRGRVDHPNLITGDLSEHYERARFGPNAYYGPITLAVHPGDLAVLLPAIMANTFSGSNITVGSTLATYGLLIDKKTDISEYQDAVIDRAIFFGRQHGPGGPPNWMILQLFVLAKAENTTDLSWPSLSFASITAAYQPMRFEDLTLTLDGTARKPKEIMVDINHHVYARYVNSLNPTATCPSHRTVRMVTRFPFDDDHLNLYEPAITGIAGTAAFANSTVGTTFNFPKLQAPANTPFVLGKTEVDITVQYAARMTGDTVELNIDNDTSV